MVKISKSLLKTGYIMSFLHWQGHEGYCLSWSIRWQIEGPSCSVKVQLGYRQYFIDVNTYTEYCLILPYSLPCPTFPCVGVLLSQGFLL